MRCIRISGVLTKSITQDPSMMNDALRTIGRPWKKIGAVWPAYGLVRIQWEGPWTEPGVPMRARYRYTHWIGAESGRHSIGIFDINCMRPGELGSGWCSLADWSTILVPHIVQQYKRATGKWHITHAIEIPEAEAAGGEWIPRKVADR